MENNNELNNLLSGSSGNPSNSSSGKPEKKVTFEEAISELETIVNKLERDSLDLEASILMFQQGIDLTSVCAKMLEDAEGKIVKLIKDSDGKIAEENFDI